MYGRLNINLSRLRDIGWTLWDPMAVRPPAGLWPDDGEDQYDSFLVHASTMMNHGRSRQDAALYLIQIASILLGRADVDRVAAATTANAIADYLQTIPGGPRKIP
jgi:hypothetical protein